MVFGTVVQSHIFCGVSSTRGHHWRTCSGNEMVGANVMSPFHQIGFHFEFSL